MPELLEKIVPQEFHDRPYLKDLLKMEQGPETFAQVFKKLDGAESLIGKRPAFPGKDAKEDEWDKFLAPLRPEKLEEYEIKVPEGQKPDEEFLKALRESFLAGDISKRQAQRFLNAFQPKLATFSAARIEKMKAEQARKDGEFDTLAKAALGEQNKAKLDRAKKLMADLVPPAVKDHLDKLDDKAYVLLSGVINAIFDKYGKEDELNPGSGGDGGNTGKSLREKAKALQAEVAKMDPMASNYDEMVAKVKEAYKAAAAAGEKA